LGNEFGVADEVAQIHAAILASLAARWAGVTVQKSDYIDYGVRAFAGQHLPADSWGELAAYLSGTDRRLPEYLQTQLRRILWAQRVLKEGRFYLDLVADMCDRPVLAMLDASGHCIVSATTVESSQDIRRAVERWMIDSAELGMESRALVSSGAVCRAMSGELLRTVVAVDGDVSRSVARADDVTIETHRTAFERLRSTVAVVSVARMGIGSLDVASTVLALGLLRVWGRWLRGFAESSPAFLLHRMIRREGSLLEMPDRWIVRLKSSPLDVVLGISGYLDVIDRVSWLTPSRIEFIV